MLKDFTLIRQNIHASNSIERDMNHAPVKACQSFVKLVH
jgi:hypothetical protein